MCLTCVCVCPCYITAVLCITSVCYLLPSSFNWIAKFVTQVVMSLSMQSAMLTTNAKASGRKLTLILIKDLDNDRQPWMVDVILKSGLLGQHDTIRTKWIPQDQDYQVKITGMVQAKIAAHSENRERVL